MMREITRNVAVGGVWFGPDYGPVPDEVADRVDRSLFVGFVAVPAAVRERQEPPRPGPIKVTGSWHGEPELTAAVATELAEVAPENDRPPVDTAASPDVPHGSIADILAWVHGNPEPDSEPAEYWSVRAYAAHETETARGDNARSTLVDKLTALLDTL